MEATLLLIRTLVISSQASSPRNFSEKPLFKEHLQKPVMKTQICWNPYFTSY